MTIPDFQSVMLPLLQLVGDGQEHSLHEITDQLANQFDLSDEERRELLASGQQAIFANRVGWARTYMKKAGLLESPRRSFVQITDRGLQVLSQEPDQINITLLMQFTEFQEFRIRTDPVEKPEAAKPQESATPEEAMALAYQRLRANLATELLQTIMSCSPSFFERLVVDLLVQMGYGGTRRDAGQAIGRSSDGGIDGIIKEDRLGLDIVYIQAKRWEGTVGRPDIQKFAGALQGQRARKGVFITTSAFTKDALDYVARIDSKIVLIDGEQLAQLMIDFGVGVANVEVYALKRVDTDYFAEQ